LRLKRRFPHIQQALKVGLTGDVTVAFLITSDGGTSGISVLRETDELFGQAAFAALQRWRFSQPTYRDTPISLRAKARFIFSLYGEDLGDERRNK
jgi:TonB family protein